MKKIWLLIPILGLALNACVPEQPLVPRVTQIDETKETGPILIGGALCVTGNLSFADSRALKGAQLAVEELNKQGGVLGRKLELTNLDCQTDPEIAGKVTDQLIQQGAKAIITPGDYYFGANSSREAQKAGLVGISTTASSPLFGSTSLGDKQFTISMWNTTMGAAAAEYAHKTRGWQSVSVITDICCDYTKSLTRYFTTQFKKLGGSVLLEDGFTAGDSNFSGQLAKIQALPSKPDFFFVSSAMPEVAAVIHTLRAAGIQSAIIGGDSYENPDLFKALGPAEGNEIYYVTHTFLQPGVTPGMDRFIAAYQAKYNQAPDALVAPGWDVVMVLAQAMEKAGSTDGAAMARAMENNEFDLLTGKLKWGGSADNHTPYIQAAMVRLDRAVPQFIGWVLPGDIPAP